jgi:Bacteriophage Sf6, terminase small subunit-like
VSGSVTDGRASRSCQQRFAREAQADKYFQEIIEIADAATPETVNVARLRVDSRKFTVARLAPKKYGDH